jgi:hypothetical protein
MATIVEVQDSKIEHLSEYADKVVRYSKKLMECLEEIGSKGNYSERYGSQYSERYGNRHGRYEEDREYSRYY